MTLGKYNTSKHIVRAIGTIDRHHTSNCRDRGFHYLSTFAYANEYVLTISRPIALYFPVDCLSLDSGNNLRLKNSLYRHTVKDKKIKIDFNNHRPTMANYDAYDINSDLYLELGENIRKGKTPIREEYDAPFSIKSILKKLPAYGLVKIADDVYLPACILCAGVRSIHHLSKTLKGDIGLKIKVAMGTDNQPTLLVLNLEGAEQSSFALLGTYDSHAQGMKAGYSAGIYELSEIIELGNNKNRRYYEHE